MILNHSRKFAYVHIQKTAGTSITSVLRAMPGTVTTLPHDFISSVEVPEGYFRFTFVRNPWDRLVSWYNMLQNKGIHNTFSRYILSNSSNFSEFLDCTEVVLETEDFETEKSYPKGIAFNQLDYISDADGRLAVDFVGRFEDLQADFDRVGGRLGFQVVLPHANRFEHNHYRTFYSDRDVEKVACLYRRDIEFFGYRF